ncbi:hypothetical protein K1T71_012536 [Dendrolimus kikuchii]|uniref:Uncharacterized protein n=1 Tax=Dendrolimus kikuchii TaxID=765133 RepID=A0ACC1CJL9_9NEOP|nr:hypothetical protein K1T71_012536 [Dendrolimus kikuchii]
MLVEDEHRLYAATPFIRKYYYTTLQHNNIAYIIVLVASSPLLASISVGGLVAYPNVLLSQLQGNTTIKLDMETSSWIGSIHGLAGMLSILMPTLMQWKGRKIAFLTSCFLIIAGWVLVYAASSVTTILISESLHGLGSNSILMYYNYKSIVSFTHFPSVLLYSGQRSTHPTIMYNKEKNIENTS